MILIGYWSGGHGSNETWPAVSDFIDHDWDEEERFDVGTYLKYGLVARAWMGYAPCRLCDKQTNGNLDLTDGVYLWPEGLAHYVLDHKVRPPEEFVRHVHALNRWSDDWQINDAWWRSKRRRAGS
ncbi:hypothetical protein IMY96_25640 [Pimelobacter simplex]|nr:hypothetical protein [Pimelobacter simplex]